MQPDWRGKAVSPAAGRLFSSPGSPERLQRELLSMEICARSFNEHLAKLSTSPELEHPVFIRIMNPVCSRSRENGKEPLQYLFF